jgi:hypothetical protein
MSVVLLFAGPSIIVKLGGIYWRAAWRVKWKSGAAPDFPSSGDWIGADAGAQDRSDVQQHVT